MSFSEVSGGICAPRGFSAAGVAAGIKRSGGLDLALIVSEPEAQAAGVFTTSRLAAAPVSVSRAHLSGGAARAIVVNSGCANACTGERGRRDAEAMAAAAARCVGASPEKVLVCSTGLIGSYLPMEKISAGVAAAAAALGSDDRHAAQAIMTTDKTPKLAAVASSEGWSIGGIAKGAGMIAPNMATMLALVGTDALVEAAALQEALEQAVEATFNRITVDGDTSTNDTVLALANGASGAAPQTKTFLEGLRRVCRSLAEQIVSDGEGAEKFVRIVVTGAPDDVQAARAARTVAESLLVKTALHGGDPNWGRIAAALGRCGAAFDGRALTIAIGGVALLDRGEPAGSAAAEAARSAMSRRKITVECDLGAGGGTAEMLTTDLGPAYVVFNSAYET